METHIISLLKRLCRHDRMTYEHSIRVGEVASQLGKELGMSSQQQKELYFCGVMHDIGKLHVPAAILQAPRKLTEGETLIMQGHTQQGFEILYMRNFPDYICEVAYGHHQYTEDPYHENLTLSTKGDVYAELVALVDMYDGMAYDRPYRKGMDLVDCFAHISVQFTGQASLVGLLLNLVERMKNEQKIYRRNKAR